MVICSYNLSTGEAEKGGQPWKDYVMVIHSYNSRTQEAETGGA